MENRKEGHLYLVTEDRNNMVYLWDYTEYAETEFVEENLPEEVLAFAKEGAMLQYINGEYILYPQNDITYNKFKEYVDYLGTSLVNRGLKNTKIGIISRNGYEAELTYMSIVCGVGCAVVMDRSFSKEEISNIIARTHMNAIFCEEEYKDVIGEINGIQIFSFENDFDVLLEEGKNLIEKNDEKYTGIVVQPEDVCTIIFTSGTTAKSKAVPLTHKNLCSNAKNTEKAILLNNSDVCLSVLPFNHIYEQSFNFLSSLWGGAKRVFANELDEILDVINKYQVTYIALVPAIYKYLYGRKDELVSEISHIKYFISGGAKIAENLINDYRAIGINIYQAYGLSETSPLVSVETQDENKIGSVGRIFPNIDVKIVNSDEDGVGEITVKGDSVFSGYFDDDTPITEYIKDGYFYTGDLGYIDQDGYLFICGRNKELIVLDNGKKVFPEELEQKINEIDIVKESFVFEKNSNIYAEIICDENENIYQELKVKIDLVNNTLPVYKRINEIYINFQPICRNQAGKIVRPLEIDKVKELIKDQSKKSSDFNNDDMASIIKRIIIAQLEIDDVDVQSTFLSLGADSLDMVTIFLNVEKEFNIKIEREKRKTVIKVGDIVDLVKEYKDTVLQ